MKWLAGVLLVLALAQALAWQPSEPFFNNDETRHVMTGVFFRDFLLDLPLDRLRPYAVEYYLQYPALGLLVWPPLFYGIEGLFMLVFGTSFLVAKALVGLFAAMACTYLFLLVRRTHDTAAGFIATLLFGLAPMVFQLSRQVMLEMPALAFALAAVFHFVRYLDRERRSDLFLAAAASAAFALTRYDAHFLLLFFGISILTLRRFDLLRRREVWLAALLALAAVVPLYLPMLREFGQTHFRVTVEGGPGLGGLGYYLENLPRQIGWAVLLPAVAGLLSALRPERRRACWPYLALAAATWLAFAFLKELQVRHTIYWVPAFALFAVEGIHWIRQPRLRNALATVVVGLALWRAVTIQAPYVRGYEAVARYVVETSGSRFAFMDGFLNGAFIYHVRRHDPGRRLWVLRGDKLLYGVLNDPRGGYKEYAGGEAGILETLFRYDPELIVVEEPQVAYQIAMAERLRQTLAAHPERFELVKTFPVESNVAAFKDVRLDVYRSRVRNPSPVRRVSFEMMGLGRSLGAEVP
ncbi:MAG TPA: glycosyltransferase family 39 protein [Thermoanaerobaculia bacterium]|nr:glycosyltransferase family 39 protein [Thermoanaerobaculia bacterium]